MDKNIRAFFDKRNLYPSSYLDAIELLRKYWSINYTIDAASTVVKIEIPFYGWKHYTETTCEAIEDAVKFLVKEIE